MHKLCQGQFSVPGLNDPNLVLFEILKITNYSLISLWDAWIFCIYEKIIDCIKEGLVVSSLNDPTFNTYQNFTP